MHSFPSTIYKHRPFQGCCWGSPPIPSVSYSPTDVVGAPTQAAASPPALAPFCFFRLKAFPAPQKIPWPAYRAAWKCQGVNIPRATLTQWRKEGKYPNFSSLDGTVWMPSTWYLRWPLREWGKPSPMHPSLSPSPLPSLLLPEITSQINNLHPLSPGLLYTMVLFQCVCNKTYTKYTFKRIR